MGKLQELPDLDIGMPCMFLFHFVKFTTTAAVAPAAATNFIKIYEECHKCGQFSDFLIFMHWVII